MLVRPWSWVLLGWVSLTSVSSAGSLFKNPSTAETGFHCCSSEASQWDAVAAGRRRNGRISIAAVEGIPTAYLSLPLHPSTFQSTTQERGDCVSGRGSASALHYTKSPIRRRFLLCKRTPPTETQTLHRG
ncbi:hypothetical protein B0T20DRAFT_67108 [Sordaria brevicollis]|uniref:Secreted protein n=1 Tax=Sordaria brevicollis TaxID=83679 RepID=A0AAE0P1Z1_SORBR|nr:hypothetical protein B0T20DRAFT_67108 [Sordaria brevicollis]